MVDKTKKPRINNLVAKHARKYNKSNVMTDRKKAEKRGYKKHSKDERTQEGVAVESLDNAKSEKDSAQIKLRHANQKVRLAKRQEREKQMKEEFTPHDMYHPETGEKKHAKTKATHLVLKARGWTHTPKEEIDSAAKKPEKYTKTDGTVGMRMVPAHKKIVDESVEQVDEAISAVVVKKMQDMVGGPDKMPRGAEFRKLKAKAQAAVKAERAGKKAAPKAQTTTKTAKGKVHKGSADAADRNLIMQLRKAQDIDGKMDIQVSPAGRTIRLSKKQIDTFLAKHDSLAKPVDKRKFKILLTKALRSKAK